MPRKNEPLQRQCAVTREVLPVSDLLRLVVGPDGNVVPDLKRKLPGRGVWIRATRSTVEIAIKRNIFSRTFKTGVTVNPDLPDMIDGLMVHAALSALSFCRKAGELVTGFAKVQAALQRDPVTAIIHAEDASDDGVRKISAILTGKFETPNGIPSIRLFNSTQLDLALGRSNVIHAALLAGRASENFLAQVGSLEVFREISATQSRSRADSAVTQD